VAGDHDGSAGVQRHLDAGHRGADAGVFGDAAASSCGTFRSARMKTRWPWALPWEQRSEKRRTFMVTQLRPAMTAMVHQSVML
jgi:hypothetical protein